ncbi:MAG: hypothetical protein HRT88_07135 [Lentisphaeraceae bacterium]|nr:hypothetical protein [Lentisphaeraceae bacterium]
MKAREKFSIPLTFVLPQLSPLEIHWRFRFMISTMIGLISFADKIKSTPPINLPPMGVLEYFIQQLLHGIDQQESLF